MKILQFVGAILLGRIEHSAESSGALEENCTSTRFPMTLGVSPLNCKIISVTVLESTCVGT